MSRRSLYWIIGVIVVIILIIAGIKTNGFGLIGGSEGSEKASGYTAVFLSNGQVYFGKLTNSSGEWLTLTDIYYLQVDQKLQPKAEETEQTKTQPKLSLVKLGNELHGPKDKMVINNKHVLFWESLKADGKVSQSIEKYLTDQANPSNTKEETTPTPTE